MDDNGTAPGWTKNPTVLSVEASDELRSIVFAWLDEGNGSSPPYSEAQHEVFKALGIGPDEFKALGIEVG